MLHNLHTRFKPCKWNDMCMRRLNFWACVPVSGMKLAWSVGDFYTMASMRHHGKTAFGHFTYIFSFVCSRDLFEMRWKVFPMLTSIKRCFHSGPMPDFLCSSWRAFVQSWTWSLDKVSSWWVPCVVLPQHLGIPRFRCSFIPGMSDGLNTTK